MRSLDHARSHARLLRQRFAKQGVDLFNTLRNLLEETHEIELVPVDAKGLLQGGRAELMLADQLLCYDRRLDDSLRELFEVIAHEYGHLILHHDYFSVAQNDLITGSVFLQTGAAGLSRYSPRSAMEAEANAFAAEFICPADELFTRWRHNSEVRLADLTEEYYATESLIRLQLAEGLYQKVTDQPLALTDKSERELTKQQQEAATFCGAPGLVDAGPGTGKTKTLVRRVVYLITERNVAPEHLLILTFSNEAATELKDRLEKVLDSDIAARLQVLTFHGFGVMILNLYGYLVGLDVDFSIIDEESQEEFISELLGTVDCEALFDLKNPEQTAAEVTRRINYLKDRLIGPHELRSEINMWQPAEKDKDTWLRSEALHRLFAAYEKNSRTKNQVDLADLILLPYQILRTNGEVGREVRGQFQWVLVDEYQDVSRSTAMLLQQVCGEESPPWVVGDARQAIYRFRGAEPENVQRFSEDFPGAKLFELSKNYRSAPEIISVVNWLAGTLEGKNPASDSPRWQPGADVRALNDTPVSMAVANSDAAERENVAAVVQSWLSRGVPPEDIAVLARRNVDVRNIAIELKRRGIKAVTSGILTAEGAGGDMAAVLTAVDHQQAMPRLIYASANADATPDELNDAVSQLINANLDRDQEWTGSANTKRIAEDTWRIYLALRSFMHTEDGWVILCEYLFFLTPYIRKLLEDEKNVTSSVQLEEVISALAVAARYRVGHRHVQPRKSRIGLAERLRSLVTQAAPGLVPPQPHPTAVRLMTCHAAKGLEFPCAAVAGQSLPDIRPAKDCLPPSLRPNAANDLLQAESLLFVGVSRAQRAAVISYAVSASGSLRSRRRKFPPLLSKLEASGIIPVVNWSTERSVDEEKSISRIWGGEAPSELSLYSLSADTCMVKTYLQEHLKARFRSRLRPMYPAFTKRMRSILSRVTRDTIETGKTLTAAELEKVFVEEWPAEADADHPHVQLYRPRAERWAKRFAQALEQGALRKGVLLEETFELQDDEGKQHTLKFQLVGHFRDVNGDRVVIVLQPNAPNGFKGMVNWSDLKDYHRLQFVLLHESHGDVRPLIFYGEQGDIGKFKWNRNEPEKATRKETLRARKLATALSTGRFEVTIDDWMCDRCPSRIICPCWITPSRGSTTKLET
jgi:DNA helicase II / ATP-dependent DNA helicase PcrA